MEVALLKNKVVAMMSAAVIAAAGIGLSGCGTGEPNHDSAAAGSASKTITVATQRQPHLFAAYEWSKYVPKS